MKSIRNFLFAITALGAMALTFGCQQPGGDATGSEMIPDMGHSVAYEANVNTEYSFNSWDEQSVISRRELSQPRLPVLGTIPRGFSGLATHDDGGYANADEAVVATMEKMKGNTGIAYTANGHVPYYFPDTEEGRLLATERNLYNPFPITKNGLARGKELYDIYCGVCHGEKGDGEGALVAGGKYPPQPAILTDSVKYIAASNGKLYHAIMYGLNAMGSYADKLSFEERWQVIHYVRSLQAASLKGVKYDDQANTLSASYGVPEKRAKELMGARLPAQTQLPPSLPTVADKSKVKGDTIRINEPSKEKPVKVIKETQQKKETGDHNH